MPEPPFSELMQRLHERDEEAARLIFDRYLARLIGLAAKRLHPALAGRTDGESVAQSALKSFFAQQAASPGGVADWNHLWNLLATITIHKCGHRMERYFAQKRDVRREQRQDSHDGDPDPAFLRASDPSPEEAVLFTETLEELFRRLEPFDADVLRLRLDDCPRAEIAEKLGCTERRVYRALARIRSVLKEMGVSDLPADEDL